MKVSVSKFVSGGMHYLPLADVQVEKFLDKGVKRVICTINKSYELHAAISRVKDGGFYVVLGSRAMKEAGLKNGQVVDISLKADDTEFQFQVPEEFMAVIQTDAEAERVFNSLTAGNKRGLIALIQQVKSSEKKIERALKIAERLKMGVSSPMKVLK